MINRRELQKAAPFQGKECMEYAYPAIKQKKSYDCGIACIAAVLEYLNIPYEYDALLMMEEINERSGCSMEQLQKILHFFGIDANGYFTVFEPQFLNGMVPFIARLEIVSGVFHYVCVFESEKNTVVFSDPAKGFVCKRDYESFAAVFTGHILSIKCCENYRLLSRDTE